PEEQGGASVDEAAEPDQAADQALLADAADRQAEDEFADETTADAAEELSATDQTEQDAGGPEVAVAPAPAAEPPREQPRPVADKGFPANVIEAITNNTMYQVALGGGLVLLLLLLLLVARRNANREKAFYDQLNSEEGDANDSFDLNLEEASAGHEETGDALAEADTYIAYGRHDQAAQTLETAISREPARADLRLKLLAVYADSQDRASFEKQFNEIEALDDATAAAEANALRERLAEAESMPSIDDLESQLRSDSLGSADRVDESSLEQDWELSDGMKAEEFEASAEPQIENKFGELESDVAEETDAPDDLIEYDLSGLEKAGDLEADDPEKVEESDFSSLEMDLEDSEPAESPEDDFSFDFETVLEDDKPAQPPEPKVDAVAESESDDFLDESFLDELDAELDKVAGEEEGPADLDLSESTLDDLELDVSDEDLALMEEFSESELPSDLVQNESPEDPVSGSENELASEALDGKPEQGSVFDIDDNDLGEEDEFDFLAGTDEAATKLDLARAYIEMGDSDGARDILEEVTLEGDVEQQTEAQELLKNLS
ncbi:MAG: FimV/HubP family polar landmark protein, partial [Marinobacter sp.]